MKILLVSPNQSLQSKLHQTLLSHRFIVDLATDGEEAWGLLQTFVYDLVILEPIVPKLDGYDLVSQASSQVPPTSEAMMDNITANIWQELMTANARLQQEIERRRKIEAQLRRSETMLRNAQRIAQVGCWYLDIHTREIYWTKELFLIHGLDPSGSPPSPEEIFSMIHPDDRQIHEEAIRTPALRGEKFEANLRIIRADNGEVRYINARGGPLHDREGKVIKLMGTTLDLTRIAFS